MSKSIFISIPNRNQEGKVLNMLILSNKNEFEINLAIKHNFAKDESIYCQFENPQFSFEAEL